MSPLLPALLRTWPVRAGVPGAKNSGTGEVCPDVSKGTRAPAWGWPSVSRCSSSMGARSASPGGRSRGAEEHMRLQCLVPLESIAGLLLCGIDRGVSWWHLCSSVEEGRRLLASIHQGKACTALPFHQSPKPEGETSMGAEESHEPQPGPTVSTTLRVAAADLRWCCDEAWLPFASTDEVEPLTGVVGQDDAIEALRFGLAITGPGQHIF